MDAMMTKPTLFEALGGQQGVLQLAQAWHQLVLADEVVSHAFSRGFHPQHIERLASYWGEAWGGPSTYSCTGGTESAVVRMHSGNGEHDEMDLRAIRCFEMALQQLSIKDTELGDCLLSYFVWTTTHSMAAYPRSASDVPDGLQMPHWSWLGLVV